MTAAMLQYRVELGLINSLLTFQASPSTIILTILKIRLNWPIQPKTSIRIGLIKAGKSVHGLGWVELKNFYNLTHYGGLKKIQPSLTQPT